MCLLSGSMFGLKTDSKLIFLLLVKSTILVLYFCCYCHCYHFLADYYFSTCCYTGQKGISSKSKNLLYSTPRNLQKVNFNTLVIKILKLKIMCLF